MEWRSRLKRPRGHRRIHTYFSIEASNCISEVVEQLEAGSLMRGPRVRQRHRSTDGALENLIKNRALRGTAIGLTFISIESLLQKVKEQSSFTCLDPDVEFVVAVRCVPYPCGVFAVWLYFGSIFPADATKSDARRLSLKLTRRKSQKDSS
uniref:Centrosomal protein of 76 kDa C-terminal domain-containing protein n=2 Tax=Octactis speculum TaxID=3111310 RepID=A0A7S2BIU0_9STRA|mmetsp:Transcript_23748/g.32509  ORF Transcript_23748/g.32509 Transcript_23748/m.32509 type:complete len:151 (+) Transcript_23748:618-1070(+)